MMADFVHSGDPTGKVVKVAGKWDAYIATPSTEKKHDGAAILYIPDVIGIWANSQLMADQFAANGYLTMVLDVLNGDPVPLNRPQGFEVMKWVTEGSDGKNPHTKEAVDPIVVAAIASLKEEHGVSKIGAVGYCFGAKVGACLSVPDKKFLLRCCLMPFHFPCSTWPDITRTASESGTWLTQAS
jgi:dienelactone hydrolase